MALGPVFFSTALSSFGVILFVAGLFGAYFGKGRSRAIGYLLSLIALLILAVFAALTWPLVPWLEPRFDGEVVGQSLVAVVAAIVGAAAAVGLFVASVVRS